MNDAGEFPQSVGPADFGSPPLRSESARSILVRSRFGLCVLLLGAVLWRLFLAANYYGSEEEDWGNLGLILGVLQSDFRYVETEHMPLFVDFAALATAALGDADRGGRAVALLGSVAATGALWWIGRRLGGPVGGWVAGALYVLQPESALYAASPLRESTYSAFCLAGTAAVVAGSRGFAAVLFPLAFLTRFDALFTFGPALLLGAAWIGAPGVRKAARGGLLGLATTVGLWAVLYHHIEGRWAFWEGVVARNTTELRQYPLAERVQEGLATVGAVATQVVPEHLGYVIVGLAFVGAVACLRLPPDPGVAPGAVRPLHRGEAAWLLLVAAGHVGFYLLATAITAYDPGHNLYWKWLCPVAPWVLLLAGRGTAALLPLLPSKHAGAAVPSVLVIASLQYLAETRNQLHRSDRWYGTQVRLVRWWETTARPDAATLADLIPASFLERRPGHSPVYRWTDQTLPEDDAAALGRWLEDRGVGLVISFREEWVGSARIAPFLAAGTQLRAGPVDLIPIAREDGYGFIAYEVVPQGDPARLHPPENAGAVEGNEDR